MSTNSQIHIRSTDRLNVRSAFGPEGVRILHWILACLCSQDLRDQGFTEDQFPQEVFPAEIRAMLGWSAIGDRSRLYHRKIDEIDVRLSLRSSNPLLELSGWVYDNNDPRIPENHRKAANKAINQLMALGMSCQIRSHLGQFARERARNVLGATVNQEITLKALAVQNKNNVAFRTNADVFAGV